jgi:hypothetical protein
MEDIITRLRKTLIEDLAKKLTNDPILILDLEIYTSLIKGNFTIKWMIPKTEKIIFSSLTHNVLIQENSLLHRVIFHLDSLGLNDWQIISDSVIDNEHYAYDKHSEVSYTDIKTKKKYFLNININKTS